MKIFDISRALSNDLAAWPGDTPFHFELKWRMEEGATVNVGAISMGVHNGTHADGTFHFDPAGVTIDRMPLDIYVGDAVVVDLTAIFGGPADTLDRTRPIGVADLDSVSAELERTSRLLVKTGVWKDSAVFPAWIPVMAPEVPEWLGTRGVKMIGLDLPSVDAIEAKKLVNHHALAAAGVAIVESLDLSAIEAGTYHFAALPLKIAGADGGPVRAVLWRD